MNWLILVVLVVILFFVYRIWRARQVAAQTLKRRNLEVSQSVASRSSLTKPTEGTSNLISANRNAGSSNTPTTKPHDSPSLRYADRSTDSTATVKGISNEVAANSDEHASSASMPTTSDATVDLTTNTASNVASDATNNTPSNATTTSNASNNSSESSSNVGLAAAVGIAGAAVGAASMAASNENQSVFNSDSNATSDQTSNSVSGVQASQAYADSEPSFTTEQNQTSNGLATAGGDHPDASGVAGFANASTTNNASNNEAQYEDDEEEIDFSDMTVDVSEMIKELNLRETDSPRLDISDDEFTQLKTGEPGEVQTKKIKNVAGKLEKMLQ